MIRIQQALDKLKKLDLSTYPVGEVKSILPFLFRGTGLVEYSLHKGKKIIRASVIFPKNSYDY